MSQDVWVVVEHQQGAPKKLSLELVSCARAIAGVGSSGKVVAFVPGSGVGQVAGALGPRGADIVYTADHPLLQQYTTDGYAAVLAEALRAESPAVVLMGAAAQGRDLAPRLAARLGAGLITDCTGLEVREGVLVATRPFYTRKAIGTVRFSGAGTRIAVVLPAMYPVPAAQANRRAEIRS